MQFGKEKIHECFNAFDVSILQTACPSPAFLCFRLLPLSLSISDLARFREG